MKFDPTRLSWVDLVIVVLLIIGVIRGRKRGMSEELLDLLKWLVMVVVAAQLYLPIADFLALNSMFSRLSWYLVIYLGLVFAIKLLFGMVKKRVGDKLVGSDIFGRSEYYLGMTAASIRYACVIIIAMAVMNARLFSKEEIEANRNMQFENFGTISFPTRASIQNEIFERSLIGNAVKNNLGLLLIKRTSPENKDLAKSTDVHKYEQKLDDVLKMK